MNLGLTKAEQKIAFLAALGGFLEFYDFAIFGFAAIYFAPAFFSHGLHYTNYSHAHQMFKIYIIFTLGYCVRPIGMILFSKISNFINQKIMLLGTIFLMGLSSLGMGLIPNYQTIGIFSIILMLFLRIIHGVASGCEIQGIIVYIITSLNNQRKDKILNMVIWGTEVGIFFGIFIDRLLLNILTRTQLEAWGWRVPFIIASILACICLIFRTQICQNLDYTKIKPYKKNSILILFRNYRAQLFTLTSIIGIVGCLLVLGIVYMPSLLHGDLATIPSSEISRVIMIGAMCTILSSFLIVRISNTGDRALKLLKVAYFSMPIAITTSFYLFYQGVHIYFAVSILTVYYGIFSRLIPLSISHFIFPNRFRIGGILMALNLGFTIFGGMSPLILSFCFIESDSHIIEPCIYMLLVTLIGIIGLLNLNKMRKFHY